MEETNFQKKPILVTGASGFIGSQLCAKLTSVDAEVHGISRKQQGLDANGMHWHQMDLADEKAVSKLFREIRPDYICHLASEVTGSRELSMVQPTLNANLISTVNLLVSATEYGCKRFVAAGSLEEPDAGDNQPIPSSPYAASKLASSNYVRMFKALYDTPAALARIFMVYGPAQRDLRKLVPYVILSLLDGREPELSNGNRQVDWIYVEDVVDGLLKMLLAPDIDGETIDLGTSLYTTTGEVANIIHNLVDSDAGLKIGALPERPMEQVRAANIIDTQIQIGWQPGITLEEGLDRTINWYRTELEQGKIYYDSKSQQYMYR